MKPHFVGTIYSTAAVNGLITSQLLKKDHVVVILGRIKLFVIAVEKTTAGRLQQLQRGGRLVRLKTLFTNFAKNAIKQRFLSFLRDVPLKV